MPGSVQLGPSDGRIVLRTYREGLAAQVGHDLVLEFAEWSATVTPPGAEGGPAIEARIDLTSLRVLEGTGGVKPLTDKDRRDIVGNARKALDTERHPQAVYRSTVFTPTGDGGTFEGTLSLHGVDRPLTLTLTRMAQGGYRARATVTQTQHGIKPYSAFFGTLKLRDAVEAEIEITREAE
jgi:polyisoprenoid-binding protein YceI